MMRRPTRRLSPLFALLVIAGLAGGCPSTFQYRGIQSQFIEATRADNQSAVDPSSADPLVQSTAAAAYPSIAAELTPERIAALDPKLRGNAWDIRGYSQWRAGLYKDAVGSSTSGLATPGLGPRDRILLQLLPALAVDSEAKDMWAAKKGTLTEADYPPFQESFAEACRALGKAQDLIDESTAPSTQYYLAYQRWRILNNWNIVIGSIDKQNASSPARVAARAQAEKTVGSELSAAARAARDSIPSGVPLRQLIKAQGGG